MELASLFRKAGFRVEADTSSESVGKKIRNASMQKIPAKIVIGQKEVDAKQSSGEWNLSVNWRTDLENQGMESKSFADLIAQIRQLVDKKVR
jgi:threonyl-tRNA synthetase